MNVTLLISLCTFFLLQQFNAHGQAIPLAEDHAPVQKVISHHGNPDGHVNCGTDERHDHLMAKDATYRKNFLYHTHQLDSALHRQPHRRSTSVPPYIIPVVVHVIHLGEPVGTGSNISEAQILDAINGLNERFANYNGQGADCEIQFCLATQTPDGCPTNGINRVDGSGVPLYAIEGIEFNSLCGADEAAIKNLSRWSPLDYYNVWVVHDICGDWAGYAHFPNGGDLDGTVIGKDFMTGDAKTLAHELGHGLNIRHTFIGDGGGFSCPPNSNCADEGDAICDTPPHRRFDCGVTNPCTNEGVWDNSRYNWMSYCDIPAQTGRFTPEQRDRMHACLMVYPRNALLNSSACTPVEQPVITSDDDPLCSGESKVVTATPPGGIFSIVSGPGHLEGNALSASGEGTIVLQYATCQDTVYQSMEAYQTPAPVLTVSNDTMCSGTAQIILSDPPGGDLIVMSGPGMVSGNELIAVSAGMIEIVYSIDNQGCTGNTSREIMAKATPEPQITSSDASMCDGEFRVVSGSPAGGNYYIVSGPASMHGDTMITEGIGEVVVGYHVVMDDCAASVTQSIMVYDLPAPVMTSSTERLCSGDARTLSAIPPGGSFSVLSGPGEVEGDTLYATGTGEIEIQYTWQQNGCSATTTQIIPAQQGPGAHFSNSQDHFCMQDSIALIAQPPGGLFEVLSGPGTLDSNILSTTSGGDILIRYAITQNGCTGSVEKIFSGIDVSQIAFTMDTSVMCSGSTRPLTAIPGGGIFWMIGGPGTISHSVLTSTGEGIIRIQYLINEEECYGEITQRISSKRTPKVEFPADSLNICIGAEHMIGVSPDSSQLTLLYGPGMLNGQQLLSIDTGVLMVTGQVESNGCVGSDTLLLISNPVPEPQIDLSHPVICNGASIPLSAHPSGGTFTIVSGAGTIQGNTLTGFDIGPVQFGYTVEEQQCTGSAYEEILVIEPVAEVIVTDDMLISSTSVGVFQWLDCEHQFEPLPGENNDTLVVTSSGSYALVNGAGDCMDTSACVQVILTSLQPGEPDQEIRVFPNPVSSCLFIDGYDGLPVKEISIWKAMGDMLSMQYDVDTTTCLDMTVCEPGIYFLKMNLENGMSYVFRVVKI